MRPPNPLSLASTSVLVLLLSAFPQQTLAWGGLAHRTVAYLASQGFSTETKVFVSTVLANDRGWDVSDAAVWPDKGVQWRRPETAQWHYIDAHDDPPARCGVQFRRDCRKGDQPGCIVSAIQNMTHQVADPHTPQIRLKEATMFLLHFVGDVHQPLHTELLARGGNDIPVCFEGACGRARHVNLHSVWDSLIPNKWRNFHRRSAAAEEEEEEETTTMDEDAERDAARLWAAELFNQTLVARKETEEEGEKECLDVRDPVRCAMAWASEANAHLCSYVLAPGEDWLRENDLGQEYYAGAVPVVEELVTKAGMRLAGWMNNLVAERMRAIGDLGTEGDAPGLVVQGGKAESFEL